MCIPECMWQPLFYLVNVLKTELDYLPEWRAAERGTHRAAILSTLTGHSICPDGATGREGKTKFVCECAQLCVGLCQEMAELSGMRCLLHSLAVGVSIMRVTEGFLCVGECFSAFCRMCMYSMYVYVQCVCVLCASLPNAQ